jgi:hypothetical protein
MARNRSVPRPDFDEIDVSVLTMPVAGRLLLGPRFEDQLKPEGTLIVFLRHLGCSFCRQTIAELNRASLRRPGYPDVLFVHQGNVAEGEALFAKAWPEARAISDPQARLYSAFKIPRGAWKQLFGPAVIARGAAAMAKGYFIGRPRGDMFSMPGIFFVRGRKVAWQRAFRHIADQPDFDNLPEIIQGQPNAGSAERSSL